MNKLYDFVLSWKIVQEECIIESLIITQMNEGDKIALIHLLVYSF